MAEVDTNRAEDTSQRYNQRDMMDAEQRGRDDAGFVDAARNNARKLGQASVRGWNAAGRSLAETRDSFNRGFDATKQFASQENVKDWTVIGVSIVLIILLIVCMIIGRDNDIMFYLPISLAIVYMIYYAFKSSYSRYEDRPQEKDIEISSPGAGSGSNQWEEPYQDARNAKRWLNTGETPTRETPTGDVLNE
jgi:hypothetical protein